MELVAHAVALLVALGAITAFALMIWAAQRQH